MSTEPFSYDRWLTLTAEEREAVLRTWNPYAGENIHIPKEAGRRFLQSSALPIVTVRVGVFHMGEYILNPELWPKDFHLAPEWFAQEFDGFRIGFCEHDPDIQWEDED